MNIIKFRGKITKSIIFLCAVLACVLLIKTLGPVVEGKAKLSEILLAQPVFAQAAEATFLEQEAGISAYVNVGQTIDLAKAKNAMRGIAAEGNNYVIGIMELPGLPEEEFPHMYVSSDGWLLAYYSKFAPASRIFQWYGYEGGTISTTTLQDAIAKICPTIGVNFSQAKASLGYYDFKYPEAAKMVIAVERITESKTNDIFNFSVPYDVTLYDGSWAHFGEISRSIYTESTWAKIDGVKFSSFRHSGLICNHFEDQQVTPGKLHVVELRLSDQGWAGVAVVFVYR